MKEKIKTYLLAHPIDRSQNDPYSEAAKKLGVDKEEIRSTWRSLRRAGLVEKEQAVKAPVLNKGVTTTTKDTQTITNREVSQEIRNEKDLVKECDIDTKEWEIKEWSCRRYEENTKDKEGNPAPKIRFNLSVKLVRRRTDKDLEKQKAVILDELFAKAPEFEKYHIEGEEVEKNYLYEISVPDIHFGKLAWKDEVGEDYDLQTACKRFTKAIDALLHRVNLEQVQKILFPIGNDMINVDGEKNMTTGGTPQDVDSRFPKIIKTVRKVLIETIDKLSTIAPVDVVVVPGNHDTETMFMLGEVMDAYYSKSEIVNVFNSPKSRKYYRFGKTSIMLTHGDKENHQNLGLIFATEEPRLWADTLYRYCQLGHLHKNKKTSYVSVDTHQGFQVQIMPSLSGTDKWHYDKGFLGLKQAKSFLFHKEEGLVGEFTYTV